MLISILALPLHFHVSRYCLRFSGEKEIFDRSPCSQQLPIKEIVSSGGERTPVSFAHYRQRLTQLLLAALQVESDSVNTHLLLGAVYKLFGYLKPLLIYLCIFLVGGLANLIHDLASYDQMDSGGTSQHGHDGVATPMPTDSASNIIPSTSETHSCHSASSTSYPSLSETTLESHYEHDTSFTGSSYNAPTPSYPLCRWHFR